MPVTDDMVATYRAFLSGDHEQWKRRRAALGTSPEATRPFFALLTGLFVEAVERRFDPSVSRDEIIGFVAEVRARSDELAERLDPHATERMISMVFDDDVATDDIPRDQTIGVRLTITAAIVGDEGMDSAQLEDFLSKSRALADEILG